MSVKEMATLLGKTATYEVAGMGVHVQITDVKQAYGRLLVEIIPLAGENTTWVAFHSIYAIR
jgi:hypothetical protein